MSHSSTIHALAEAHEGLLTRRILLDAGVPESSIEYARSIGRLITVHAGVYRTVGTAPDRRFLMRAALAATAPHGVLSHRTATSIHQVRPATEIIEITVPHSKRPRLDGVMLHRSLRMPDAHLRTIEGLRVTSVERTLGDIGAVLREDAVRASAETAVVRRLTTVARLFAHVDDHARRGRNGIGVLRSVLEEWMLSERPPDSELEIAFMRLVRFADLPTPRYQYEIRNERSELVARVDAAWPDDRLIVEVDGFSAHGTPSAMQHDLARQNRLIIAGWSVIRFTWHDIVRRPAWVAAQIRDALLQVA